MEKYKPISCSFIDWIEHHATLGHRVKIKFQKPGESVLCIESQIKTWVTQHGAEYLVTTDHHEPIRLDWLISIDDQQLQQYC